MSFGIRTVAEVLTEVREILDEPLDSKVLTTNLWSNTELVKWMNRGTRRVWAHVKKERENYFVRTVKSDSTQMLRIYGREYDPSELRCIDGRKELKLPPDFSELVVFEPVPTDDQTNGDVQFIFTQLMNSDFRTRMRSVGPDRGGVYECDVIHREAGPVIIIEPELAIVVPIDVRLEYVHGPIELTEADSFEGSGFNQLMLDAVINYVVYRARKKEENTEQIKEAQSDFGDTLDVVGSAVGPRQVRDEELVDGYLEDFLN
jgi:hypothetical protein